MSALPGVPDVAVGAPPQPQIATLGWTLRRAALGLGILLTVAVLGAWLMYASIEPDEATAGPASHSEYAIPQD
jgi:hypothetical protein